MPCAAARHVLQHVHFREQSGLRGWSCWRGTPAFGFTSLVYGCWGPKGQALQAVPANALPRIGQGCRLFRGPGDTAVHSVDFRAHAVSCQTAKEVVEICEAGGATCNAGTSAWSCVKPKQRPMLGFAERCTSGKKFTNIVWLD
jgi:hypothetical protein